MTGPGDENISEMDLHAYVDGQLDESRVAEVESFLAANPDAASLVASYREQNSNFHENFDGVLDDPIPPTLLFAAQSPAWWRTWRVPVGAVAALILLFVGGTGGWVARGLQPVEPDRVGDFTRHAGAAHRIYTAERRFAVEVAAKEEKRMVRWLSKRLGTQQLRVPSLDGLGFELVGARQLATSENLPAAQFMYQDKKLRRLTLYMRKSTEPEQTSFRFAEAAGSMMYYWNDKPFAYALVGKLDKEELLKVSRAVSDQISP